MVFGKRLRDLRRQKGITLESLAAKIGSSKGYLSGIENEKVNPPTEKFVRKLARVFGQDEVEFLKLAYLDKIPRVLQSEFGRALDSEGGSVPRHRPGENSGVLPCRIPLLNRATQGYPSRLGPTGFPEALSEAFIQIPGIHPTHTFALTVCGNSGAGFRIGDIVLVSKSERIESGDHVFAIFTDRGRRQGLLRQAFFPNDDSVVLQGTNREPSGPALKRADLDGLFRVIGKIEIFTSSPIDSAISHRESVRS